MAYFQGVFPSLKPEAIKDTEKAVRAAQAAIGEAGWIGLERGLGMLGWWGLMGVLTKGIQEQWWNFNKLQAAQGQQGVFWVKVALHFGKWLVKGCKHHYSWCLGRDGFWSGFSDIFRGIELVQDLKSFRRFFLSHRKITKRWWNFISF